MALEWLKTALGAAYNEELEKTLEAAIGQNTVPRSEFNEANTKNKTLSEQVKERDTQIEGLKKVDPTQLQAEITRLQGENTAAVAATETKYQQQLTEAKRDFKMETALMSKYKAHNPKAVLGLLDRGKISLDGENLIGFDEQIQPLLQSDAYLFGQSTTPQRSSLPHSNHPPAQQGDNDAVNDAIRGVLKGD